MPYYIPSDMSAIEIFPGGISRLACGEHLMLSLLEMAQDAVVPEHSHPNEQGGIVLQGRLRLRIGSEEHLLQPGEMFIVPPNTLHSGVVEVGPLRVMDVFGPPRADYRARMASES